MNESPQYEAFRAFARAEIRALVLEAKNDLKEILTREAPKAPGLNIDDLERRVWEKVVAKIPAAPTFEQPKDGKDAVGIAGVTMRSGDLVVRLSDGTEQNVGRVAGEKGDKGDRGDDGDDGKDSTAKGDKGDAGEPGTDGVATEAEIDAKIEARFADMQTRSLADYHKRTYEKGTSYKRGDLTVWDGTTWLAMSDTKEVPGTSPDWQQFAKKGRDGRDRTDKGPYSK